MSVPDAGVVQHSNHTDCICHLHNSGITVRAVTADGNEVNIKMFKNLGMSLDCPSFMHTSDSSVNIYGICDACHMLKLVQNTLADLKILRDGDNNVIKWSYVQNLVDIQETSGIRGANKVSVHHVNFHKHKMKVKLAAQVLSKSVADALDFLRADCNDLKQLGNEATVQFIRVVDNLFDLLNCHSPFGKGPKSALRLHNVDYWKSRLEAFCDYFLLLKSGDGISMLEHCRKTGFWGFIFKY